jgi:hypothetical protein
MLPQVAYALRTYGNSEESPAPPEKPKWLQSATGGWSQSATWEKSDHLTEHREMTIDERPTTSKSFAVPIVLSSAGMVQPVRRW